MNRSAPRNIAPVWSLGDMEFRPRIKKKHRPRKFTGYNINAPSPSKNPTYIGLLCAGTTNNVLPNEETCKATFIDQLDSDDFLLNLSYEECDVIVKIALDAEFLEGLISSKVFALRFKENDGRLFIEVFFSQLPVDKLTSKNANTIKTLFALLFDIQRVDINKENTKKCAMTESDIQELFERVQEFQKDLVIEQKQICHDGLRPTLRPYQENAVQWMIQREKKSGERDIMHPMYEKVRLEGGTTVYYNKYTAFVQLNKPLIEPLRTGGILADEMGLGKTVEVLACILSNPKLHKLSTTITIQSNLNEKPIVEHQPKRRKIDKKPEKVTVNIVEDDNTGKSKKSVNKRALENWYRVMLEEVSVHKRKPAVKEDAVQCICGNLDKKGIVLCTFCNKLQHANCLGFTSQPDSDSLGVYICPQCWMEQPLLDSTATLIICPATLRKQWLDEICRHLAAKIKVLNYQGSSVTPVYPTHLQKYDLVLTTYNVLQADLRLSETGQEFNLRRQRKYSAPGSSITRLRWWRLCFDEAQTVETGRLVSEMAWKLTAEHRWAVTGTPISKDITDLYGLIDALQLNPYSNYDTWEHLLLNPYLSGNPNPMYKFLSQTMWRSSKNAVIEQIQLPKQTVEEHFVSFSAVEKYFYKREHVLCSTEFMNSLRPLDLNTPLKKLNKSELKKILAPLLTLRQACVHPSLTRGRHLARKQVSSMEELLDALIARNITESEEALRLIISSLNGLAGIYLLLQNPIQAVEEYRKVLQLAERFNMGNEQLTVDSLQLIHTMYNLSEILATASPVPPTLRDASLTDERKKLEEKYIGRYLNQSKVALEECMAYSEAVSELQGKFILTPGEWYVQLVNYVSENNLTLEFTKRIQFQHENHNVNSSNVFCNERRILNIISKWDDEISELGSTTMNSINRLYTKAENGDLIISKVLVESATDCHLRPPKKVKGASSTARKCLLCVANDNLNIYECKLYSSVKKGKEGASDTCAWKPSSEELIFKALYSLAKSRNLSSDLITDGKTHLKLLDLIKKEFKEIRKLWTCLDKQICAQDEVHMCKTRLQLKSPGGEEKTKKSKADAILKQLTDIQNSRLETIHMLHEHELDYHRAILQGEEKSNTAKLNKSLGVSSYLKTVKQQQYSGQSADPCPICKSQLQDHWSILLCGHCYCLDCLGLLISNDMSVYMNCPICRQRQKISEIAYIKHGDSKNPQKDTQIKGNFSSKIEAIVILICKLKKENPDVKVLLFSTWINVLKVFEIALEKNDVTTAFLTQNCIDKTIQKFKDENKKITALLLPVSLGSKGLNLIEATHVIFAEPLLNPGDELQAVGRVHRIGQTKPTVVHKFIVRDTIEENIYKAISSNAKNWDKNIITLKLLKDLFVNCSAEEEYQMETENV